MDKRRLRLRVAFFMEIEFARELKNIVVVRKSPGTRTRRVRDQRIRTHRKPANRFSLGHPLANEVVKNQAG